MAPLEEPQLPIKEQPKTRELTAEFKQENYSKAIKNAIDIFSITANNDDDDTLTKSHTMSMATMFKSADHLPFIVGSKLFAQDEFLGIIEKTDNVEKYLRDGQGFIDDGQGHDMQASPSSGLNQGGPQNNMASRSNSMLMSNGPPRSGFAYPEGSSNVIEIKNTSLGPPPPFQPLLEQYEANHSYRRPPGNQQRPAANMSPGRNPLLSEIENRSNPNASQSGSNEGAPSRNNMLSEIQNGGGRQKTIQEMLNEQIGQRNRPQQPAPIAEPEGAPAHRLSEIRNNPLYQPTQVQSTRQTRLFDEDEEEVEVGNTDLFKPSSQNKRKFDNLLTNPQPAAGSRLSNPLLNPLSANPFDPFGLSNPFLPLNPKAQGGQQAEAPVKQTPKEPAMNLASEIRAAQPETRGREEPEKAARASKLNKLFEDSDEDEETRLNKQKELSQKYRSEAKPKVEEKPAAPVQKPGGRVSKLFDDEEDTGFMPKKAEKPAPKKETVVPDKTTKTAGKKKLFDDEEEETKETPAPVLNKKQSSKKEETSVGNPLGGSEISPPRQSKPAAKTTKSLFDDDDNESPLGGAKAKKPEAPVIAAKPKGKKSLFNDDDEEEPKQVVQPKEVKPAPQKAEPLARQSSQAKKKSLFNDDEEEEEPIKPVKQVTKTPPPVAQEIKAPVPVPQEVKKEPIKVEPKPEVKPQTVEGFRPMKEDPLFDDVKPTKSGNDDVKPPVGAGNDLTKLIKAAQMARKKKFGDSDEENSDSSESDRAPPVRKSVPVTVQPTIPQETKVEEPVRREEPKPAPIVREEPKQAPIVREEPKVEEVKPRVSEKPSVPVTEEIEEPAGPSMTKQSSNISSRISNLQSQLNLNMNALRPSEGLPSHMRKHKPSLHEEESGDAAQTTGSEETKAQNADGVPNSVSMALDKPIKKGVAKKTVMFEDDEEEDEDPLLKKFTAAPKPVSKPVENKVYEQPKAEASPLRPSLKTSSPTRADPLADPLGQRGSTATRSKSKPKFDDDDDNANDPLGFGKKPQATTSAASDVNNPLALLKGLKAMDEQKGSKKSVTIKETSKSKSGLFDDDDDPLAGPSSRKSGGTPQVSGPGNPLALLSGLKEMDAGRKSTKSKSSKTADVYNDPLSMGGRSSSKPKGIFDDDEDSPSFKPKGPSSVKPKPVEEPKAKPKESGRLTKLFDDSDEDKGGMFGKPAQTSGKPAQTSTKSKPKAKPAGGLFDDDD